MYLRNIKKGYATNSSSYHSTLILTEEEYKKWKNNEEAFGKFMDGPLWFKEVDNEDTLDTRGMYYYYESEDDRVMPNGEKIYGITICETNEY